jgi:hypothetical protein
MTDDLARIAEVLEDNASRATNAVQRQIMTSNAALVRDAKARIEALTAQLESTLRDRKLILEERDRTFALMLARAEKAEADNARLRAALECLLIEYDYAELAQDEPPSLTAAVFSARAALNTGKEPT